MRPKVASEKAHQRARILRNHLTEAEARLWAYLRRHQLNDLHFRRQYAIGKYIVDFCAPYQKLVIEVDGSQHLENKDDEERSAYLISKGYRVLRFWNHEVMNDIAGVLKVIDAVIGNREEKE